MEILDKDKLFAEKNDPSPISSDCRLGKYENEIIKYDNHTW